MKIYHTLNENNEILLYVEYPLEYEFGLDFDSIKENIADVSDKIHDYACKNFKKITNTTALVILNGVIVGSLFISDLIYKNTPAPIKSKFEISTSINTSQNIITKQIDKLNKQEHSSIQIEKEIIPVNEILASNNSNKTYSINNQNNTPNNIVTSSSNSSISNDKIIKLKLNNGNIINIGLEDYVIGVVGAEMPASFLPEALKAQAVATRTYAFKKIDSNKVLTASTNDQVYKSQDELKKMWGNYFNTYYSKVKNAVIQTKGEVITYNGNYIDALYFSTSNGKTEEPKYIWGSSLPYLKSVMSPWDTSVHNFSVRKNIPLSTISSKLGVNLTSISQIKINSKTIGNRINSITIAGKKFTGNQVRSVLGLRSADFDVSQNGKNIIFTTYGYGHGVGMSQYGANGMAKSGKNYKQILKYYYTGVNIVKK